ncbi:uncharacterized protein LOC129584129 [Paramacrobiotus metropolitanus]|uniref:uncharacterized protein LOC129584129 n=1 Tax=Paramacrobiotus metropolitanus TaxID=2943436 RepID=UPI002445FCBF|nr:uncharacterized protein LOC129584129 [Paramacrobiotus metropolitanus]
MDIDDKTVLAEVDTLNLDIPFALFVKFFLGWNCQKHLQIFLRYLIPVVCFILFIIDFCDWVYNGHESTYEVGKVLSYQQSPIISLLSYMTSQISYMTASAVLFGFIAKSSHIRSALYQMTNAGYCGTARHGVNSNNIMVSARIKWLYFGYFSLAVAATIHVATSLVFFYDALVATRDQFWKPEPYFVWHIPSGLNDLFQRIPLLFARLLPFVFYVLYYYLATLLTNRIVSLNVKLNLSILGVKLDSVCFESSLLLLQAEDEELATIVGSLSSGFSLVLAGGIFGSFLQICSSTALCFVSNMFSTPWSYIRQAIFIAATLIVLLMFLLSGARLHEAGKEAKRLWTDLIISHQDYRKKILPNVDDARLMFSLYRISQRSECLTLADFVHLTRSIAATFVFAFIGYLCFLVERSEHFQTDEKLTDALRNNLTLVHNVNVTHS